jgi:hypothetical protein
MLSIAHQQWGKRGGAKYPVQPGGMPGTLMPSCVRTPYTSSAP